MLRARVFLRLMLAGIAVVALSGVGAFADRSDQNNHFDRSGPSNHSFHSGSGQSSRNSSGGQSSARSFSPRQSQSVQVQSTDSSARSFGGGSRGTAFSGRSFSTQSFDGSSNEQSSSAIRAVGGQGDFRSSGSAASNRDSGNTSAFLRGWAQRTTAFGADRRNSSGPNGSASSTTRADTSGFNSRTVTNRYNAISREFDPSRSGGNSQNDNQQQGSRFLRSQDSSAHPTADKVQVFLQRRRNSADNRVGTGGEAAFNRQFSNREKQSELSSTAKNESGLFKLRQQLNDAKNGGDRAWIKQFGNGQNTLGNSSQNRTATGAIAGKNNAPVSNALSKRTNRFSKRLDKTSLDHTYLDWRKKAVGGDRQPGTDQRDWSGRWKNGERFEAAINIRDQWKNHSDHKNLPFSNDWWRHHGPHDGHHGDWGHFAKWHRPYHWWNWCSAPRLTTW
ncbi:MAG TPA: hypothetical protein VFW73_00720, partial [Lacipirellulaceae bacterium]|nr:hypothetical protein [Lacipirellulaceae bacterium]